jgi:hypothetical protein
VAWPGEIAKRGGMFGGCQLMTEHRPGCEIGLAVPSILHINDLQNVQATVNEFVIALAVR